MALDRKDAVAAGAPLEIARRGAYAAIDHAGDVTLSERGRAKTAAALRPEPASPPPRREAKIRR